ncbi:hypothetical protein M378DRAFT_180560 [Amanita muscaria Koide BX008]|uniref:Uncharacterized protein n=1 Tax=Amanita muscaria (strain Koide BX008) TaxID=946122 RepID=A0A0C2WFB9_AMAMK|nr:hypothetical protein M378DRAFT_180560 [Amanita muscaria Koide BX008]
MLGFAKGAHGTTPGILLSDEGHGTGLRAPPTSASAEGSVTFFPASHKAAVFQSRPLASADAPDDSKDGAAWTLFRQVYKGKRVPAELLQTSIPLGKEGSTLLQDVVTQPNGFVHTVIEAYNRHRALIIRPDDVWLAILIQFNFFVNGNAELLRKHFVSHEGKEELIVVGAGNRYTADFAGMSRKMTQLMKTRIVDPDLQDWVIPTFSTTTIRDTTVYAMVMMAALKEYFSYTFSLRCGIPQVTLEGTKEDWESLLSRLAKLKEYGKEAEAWYRLLQPIISQFVAAYEKPNSAENLDFWNKVAHIQSGGSGPTYLAGWITAFCFFSAAGTRTETIGGGTCIDGVTFPKINMDKIPGGIAEVDVLLDDNGVKFDSLLVAGSIGTQICADANSVRNTVKPLPAWWYLIIGLRKET